MMDTKRISERVARTAAGMVELFDGMGRKVRPTKRDIAKALNGPTSMVADADDEVSLLFDENNGEYDLFDGRRTEKFFDEQEAIREFLFALEGM